jgi:uncharacterized integral membrane protein
MKKAKIIGVVAAIVLAVIVILQNTQPVETRFLFFKATMPNAVLLALTLLVGMAIGILLVVVASSRRSAANKNRKSRQLD